MVRSTVSNFIQKRLKFEHILGKRSHGYFNFGYLFYLSDFGLKEHTFRSNWGGSVDIIYNAEVEFEQKIFFFYKHQSKLHAGIGIIGFNFCW